MGSFSLGFLGLGWISAIAQILLFREFLGSLSGHELCLGLVMGSWLLWIALGAIAGSFWIQRRTPSSSLFLIFPLLMTLCVPFQVAGARLLPLWLKVDPGQMISLRQMLLAILLVNLPGGWLLGMGFPLGLAGRTTCDVAGRTGKAFGLEALGSGMASLLFTFVLAGRFTALESWSIVAFLYAASCLVFLTRSPARKRMILVALFLLSAGFPWMRGQVRAGDIGLSRQRWSFRFPHVNLIEVQETRIQQLGVGERQGQNILTGNGSLLFVFPDPYAVPEIVQGILTFHPAPRSLLLLGGNLPEMGLEALKIPGLQVTGVELDPGVLAMQLRHISDEERQALQGSPMRFVFDDARRFLKGRERYDMILSSLPEPSTVALNRFYTREFYRSVADSLNSGGIFSLSIPAGENYFSGIVGDQVFQVWSTLSSVFPEVLAIPGEKMLFLASTSPGTLITDPVALGRRFEERGINSPSFSPSFFETLLQRDRIETLRALLEKSDRSILNTDDRPISLLTQLSLWSLSSDSGLDKALFRISRMGHGTPWILLCVLAGVGMILARRTGDRMVWGRSIPVLAIFSTGLSTMGLALVSLFAVQSAYGYVYHRMGLLIACYMIGLALGSLVLSRWAIGHRIPLSLRRSEMLLLLLFSISPWAFKMVVSLPIPESLGQGIIGLCLFLAALLAALQFPLASQAFSEAGALPGVAGGLMDAADHAGALFGALIVGVILVPVMGLFHTLWILAGLKGCVLLIAMSANARESSES